MSTSSIELEQCLQQIALAQLADASIRRCELRLQLRARGCDARLAQLGVGDVCLKCRNVERGDKADKIGHRPLQRADVELHGIHLALLRMQLRGELVRLVLSVVHLALSE